MYIVPIFDKQGDQVDQLEINDEIVHVNGRVSKGKHYYKGIGVPYQSHHVVEMTDDYDLIEKSEIFYLGYLVKKPAYVGKFGIFHESYQPQFEDFIGTCGVKEVSIIEHSMAFEKSSVDVLKAEHYDKVHGQYFFLLDYKCGRRSYLEGGYPKKLRQLLDYMVQNNWNFIWDKNSITDISFNGLVSDVADIFQSSTLTNKLGTVYSVLYSLSKANRAAYIELLAEYRLKHEKHSDYVMNSVAILKANKIDVSSMFIHNNLVKDYKHIVQNYLIVGKNCGHCSFIGLGEDIKREYQRRTAAGFTKS